MKRRTFVSRSVTALGGLALGGPHADAIARTLAIPSLGGTTGRADIVLRRALVYDGSGGAPFHADVAVAGGRIGAIGERLAGVAG